MNKLIISAAVAASALVLSVAPAFATTTNNDHHNINVCHVTNEDHQFEKTPFVVISVDSNAHLDKGDFLYTGAVDSKGKATDNNWCVNHQPGDLCSNIDGKQLVVPDGLTAKDGVCTAVVVVPVVPVVVATPAATPKVAAPTVLPNTGGFNFALVALIAGGLVVIGGAAKFLFRKG